MLTILIILNIFAFFLYGYDKMKALSQRGHGRLSHGKRKTSSTRGRKKKTSGRIPETTLLLVAAVGGSIGAWLGMLVWRHKTRHKKFQYGVPAIIIAQLVLVLALL